MDDQGEAQPAPTTGASYLPIVRQLEGSGDNDVSSAGAIGRYQIMPGTARQYGFDPAKLSDPAYNEQAATAILSDLNQRFNGDAQAVLAAYNAGPTAARRWIAGGKQMADLPPETQHYIAHASQIMQGGGLQPNMQVASGNATPDLPPEPSPLSAGQRMIQKLQQSGQFSDDQISGFYGRMTQKLIEGGYKPDAISDFWGEKTPNQGVIDAYVEHNLRQVDPGNAQKVANSPLESFAAGYNMSVTHLKNADTLPNTVMPADAPVFNKIMEGTGQALGDFPYMVAGAVGGAAAGSEVPVVGTAIGTFAGAGALPAAMREIYLDRLRMREVNSAQDFLGMAGKSLLNVGEATATSILGGKAAQITGGAVTPYLGRVAGGIAATVSNALTYTGLSSAFQGKIPNAGDALATAVVALGIHGASEVGGRLVPTEAAKTLAENQERVWAETGMTPGEQVQKAANDRVVAQEIMTRDVNGDPVIPHTRQLAPDEPKPYQEVPPLVEKQAVAETSGNPAGEGKGPDLVANPPAGPPKVETTAIKAQTFDELNERASTFIGEEKPSSWWGKVVDGLTKFYRQWVSELGPARAIDNELIKAGNYDRKTQMGLEDMLRQTYASDHRAGLMVTRGGIDPITLARRPDVPSLRDGAQAVAEDSKDYNGKTPILDAWVNYMVAKRANDLEARGLKTGHPLSLAERQDLVTLGNKYFARGTALWNSAMDGALEYGRDSGLFNQDQVDAMRRDNPMYISFRRLLGADETPKAKGRGFKAFKPLKDYEGEDGQITNPLLATIDNMHQIVRAADRNRAAGAAIALAESLRTGPDNGPAIFKIGEKEYTTATGQPQATIAEPGSDLFKPYTVEDTQTYDPFLAMRMARRSIAPDTFMYLRDGKAEYWKATDPDLASIIRGADSPGQLDPITKGFQALASLQRAGITADLAFPLRILGVRHPLGAYIFDPLHPTPVMTILRGITSALTKDGVWEDWVAKGGAGAQITEIDRDYLQRDIQEVLEKTGAWDRMWNVLRHPLQAAQVLTEKLDAAARIGYKATAEGEGVDAIKAATMGRKAMIDYGEKSTAAFAQWLARVTPFQRPDILGLKMAAEGVATDPWGVARRAFYAVTVPQMVLYAMNALQDKYGDLPEDQKYRNLPQYQRDLMYVLPSVGGVRLRIPLPFVAGVPFGAIPLRVLDHFRDTDTDAFNHWAKTLVSQFVPNFIPTAVTAPMQWWANKNWFTGHPLIPDRLEGASGPMQYTPYTTEISKRLSQIAFRLGANISPINLDQITQDLAGTTGYAILKAGNYALRPNDPKPAELADMPFISSFLVRNPGMSAEPIQQFYDKRDALTAALKDKEVALERLRVRDPNGMQQYQAAIDQVTQQVAQANVTAKAMRALMSAIDGINNDPLKTPEEIAKMSPAERSSTHARTLDDKRQLIDQYAGLMIELSRAQLGAWKGTRDPQEVLDKYRDVGSALSGGQ